MNGSSVHNDDEKMPVNLRFDKALPYYIPGAADSSFAGSSISRESSFSSVDQDTTPLSRNSSFSSSSAGSTIDTDSSVSRSSSRRSNEDETLSEQRRRLRAARAIGKNSAQGTRRENGINTTAISIRPSLLMQGRSSSAGSETPCVFSDISRLSAPDALMISTPPGNSFMQFRYRSRSWNCNDTATDKGTLTKSDSEDRNLAGSRVEERNITGSKESLPGRLQGGCCDAAKRTQSSSRAGAKKQLKQVEALKKEIEELRRERDRFKCERDAMELERDALLRDKEELEKELENRSSIIRHMKDHMKILPVTGDDSRPKMKHRSISEIKRPVFFSEGPCTTNKQNSFTSF